MDWFDIEQASNESLSHSILAEIVLGIVVALILVGIATGF